jgi:restriction system protein
LRDPANWARLGWNIDHEYFLKQLTAARDIRNEVMHYSPDPFLPEDYRTLEGLLELLRTVDPTL